MALNLFRLEKVKERTGGKIEAQCPACFELGSDSTGDHLVVYPDGAFACTVYPGD